MEHRAIFQFRHPLAEQIYRAVAPEMAGEVHPRSIAHCSLEGPSLITLSIDAADIPAMRASLNMWLRLINLATEMQELVAKETKYT